MLIRHLNFCIFRPEEFAAGRHGDRAAAPAEDEAYPDDCRPRLRHERSLPRRARASPGRRALVQGDAYLEQSV